MKCLKIAVMVAAVVLGAVGAFGATVTLQQGANGYKGSMDRDMWGSSGAVFSSGDEYLVVNLQ